MSSRRSFLGAAAALSLPTTAAGEGDPSTSTPGDAEGESGSSARISARVSMRMGDSADGSASVHSITYRLPDAPRWEAELVLTARAFQARFVLDREAVTDLRDTLAGDSPDGYVSGTTEVFVEGLLDEPPASLAVRGERLRAEGAGVEAVVATDEDLRADLVDGLDAALADASVVEE